MKENERNKAKNGLYGVSAGGQRSSIAKIMANGAGMAISLAISMA
jgi:hypothetical protein